MIDLPDNKDAKQPQPPPAARKAAEREVRLKAQMKANLARRKSQARARREGAEDARPGDLTVPAISAGLRPGDGGEGNAESVED